MMREAARTSTWAAGPLLLVAVGFAVGAASPRHDVTVSNSRKSQPAWPGDENTARTVTFTHDIAPILFHSCAPCHHPGEAAPFSLLTFTDAKTHAGQIASPQFYPEKDPANQILPLGMKVLVNPSLPQTIPQTPRQNANLIRILLV